MSDGEALGLFPTGSSWRRVRRKCWETAGPAWQDIRPLGVVGLALLAVALGTWGFKKAGGPDEQWLDSLYSALQLFGLGGGDQSSPPWQLQIARFLAPALVGYAAIRGIIAISRHQLRLLSFRLFLRNHVIVAGLGDIGMRLATTFHDDGNLVVAIERDPSSPGIAHCRERGIGVLTGDARDPGLLDKVRATRAEYLLATCGSDQTNLEVAAAARTLATRRPLAATLTALVELDSRDLWERVKGQELNPSGNDEDGPSPFRQEVFNVAEHAAEQMLAAHSPLSTASASDDRSRVLIVADQWLGGSLVGQTVNRWKEAPSSQAALSIALAGPAAAAPPRLDADPQTESLCELRPIPEKVDSARFAEADGGATAIYVALADDATGLATALALYPYANDKRVKIVLAVNDDAWTENALPGPQGDWKPIEAFGVLKKKVLGPDLPFRHMSNEMIERKRADHEIRRRIDASRRRNRWIALSAVGALGLLLIAAGIWAFVLKDQRDDARRLLELQSAAVGAVPANWNHEKSTIQTDSGLKYFNLSLASPEKPPTQMLVDINPGISPSALQSQQQQRDIPGYELVQPVTPPPLIEWVYQRDLPGKPMESVVDFRLDADGYTVSVEARAEGATDGSRFRKARSQARAVVDAIRSSPG
jgi:hypothetical protein